MVPPPYALRYHCHLLHTHQLSQQYCQFTRHSLKVLSHRIWRRTALHRRIMSKRTLNCRLVRKSPHLPTTLKFAESCAQFLQGACTRAMSGVSPLRRRNTGRAVHVYSMQVKRETGVCGTDVVRGAGRAGWRWSAVWICWWRSRGRRRCCVYHSGCRAAPAGHCASRDGAGQWRHRAAVTRHWPCPASGHWPAGSSRLAAGLTRPRRRPAHAHHAYHHCHSSTQCLQRHQQTAALHADAFITTVMTTCPPVYFLIKTRRLRFFGCVAHSYPTQDHHRAISATLWSPGDWRRPRGRPHTTWLRGLMLRYSRLTSAFTVWRKTNDHVLWRHIINTAHFIAGSHWRRRGTYLWGVTKPLHGTWGSPENF